MHTNYLPSPKCGPIEQTPPESKGPYQGPIGKPCDTSGYPARDLGLCLLVGFVTCSLPCCFAKVGPHLGFLLHHDHMILTLPLSICQFTETLIDNKFASKTSQKGLNGIVDFFRRVLADFRRICWALCCDTGKGDTWVFQPLSAS